MRKAVAAGSIVAAALVSVPIETPDTDSDILVVADESGAHLYADGNDTLRPPVP